MMDIKLVKKELQYTKLKKCCFNNKKIRFFGYIISLHKICILKKQIKAAINLFESKSV